MAKAAKIFLSLLIFIIMLAIGAVVVITQWINPNDWKSHIESRALDQGIPLQITGDLSWQFFPSLGISIGQTFLYETPAKNKRLVSIDTALAKVAVTPLLKKQLVVETLYLKGFQANLVVDTHGQGNWEAIAKAQQAKTKDESKETQVPSPSSTEDDRTSNQPLPFELLISQIHIQDGYLNFSNLGAAQNIELSGIQLMLSEVNFEERWFPVSLALNAHIKQADQALIIHNELSAQLKVDSHFDQLAIQSGKITTQVSPSLSDLEKGNLETVHLTFFGKVAKLSSSPEWQAKAEIQTFNAKKLLTILPIPQPDMNEPSALQSVRVSLQTSGTPENVQISPLIITLDQTTMKVDANLKNFETLLLTLKGDQLNLDDYLPPSSEAGESATHANEPSDESAQPSATTPEQEDPFAALRTFVAHIDLQWDHLIANKLHFNDLVLKAKNQAGVAEITQLSTRFYDGNVDLKGQLDARSQNSQLHLTGDVSDVKLNPLLKDLIDNPNLKQYALEGTAFSALKVNSQGTSITQLIEGLDATLEANTQSLKIAPVNLQRYVCQAVALLAQKKLPEFAWPESTQLQDVKATIHVKDQIATLENFNAGVENFLLGSLGEFNLQTHRFDIRFPFTLLELSQQPKGCPKPNTHLINQTLSLLKCDGSLTHPACKLDAVAIREKAKSLLAKRAKDELKPHQEKLEKKLEQEKGKLEDKLKKKLGEELGDDVKEKLKGIFKIK